MKAISRDIIEENLQKKGFVREKGNSDHRIYYFHYNGKKTHIRTKISHGSKYRDYGIDNLRKMKLQLKFDSSMQIKDFLLCPITKEEYISLLKNKKEL